MKFPRVPNLDQTNNFRIPCTGEDPTFLKISFWSLSYIIFFGTLGFLVIGLSFFFKRGWCKELYCGNLSFHVSYEIYLSEYNIRIIFYNNFLVLVGFYIKILLWIVDLYQFIILKIYQTFHCNYSKKHMSIVWLYIFPTLILDPIECNYLI